MTSARGAATALLSLWLLSACGAIDPPPPPPESWSSETRLLTRPATETALRVGSLSRDDVSRHGVWVPAGKHFGAEAAVPVGGVLGFTTEAVDAESGASVRFAVDAESGASVRFAVDAESGASVRFAVDVRADSENSEEWHPLVPAARAGALETHRLDLASWEGRELSLRFRAEGAAGSAVFFGEPAVFVPSASPRRVVLLFVDTLRPDHLGFLGYHRDTSPRLDALARNAAIFEVARAPAPWTLPSARAALSGRQPEAWEEAPHLGERLAAHGFVTLGTTSNAFLGAAFGMERGWTEYQMEGKAIASAVVDRALAQLARHVDRDLLLLVHFMDPHLPYREPEAYQGLFDRSEHAEPGATIDRQHLLALDPGDPDFERERRRIVDRYDQTIRYLDDELARLLEAIGRDATVVLFSDHGEEFWEHGGAEHGHTLLEELLRVPLVVRDPALPPGRHTVPASLLDILPTVLELVGLPAEPADGLSLVGVARGEAGADEALAARPEAFGRTLYGGERWAVRNGDHKWSTWAGRQILVNLAEDPGERQDLSTSPGADLPGYVGLLGEILHREVLGVWRVLLGLPPTDHETRVQISHPEGIADAWLHRDPLGRRSGSTLRQHEGRVELVQPAGATAPTTLTLIPSGRAADPRGLRVAIQSGGKRLEGSVAQSPPPFAGGATAPLLRIGDETQGVLVLPAVAPRPSDPIGPALEDDLREALEELGYLE